MPLETSEAHIPEPDIVGTNLEAFQSLAEHCQTPLTAREVKTSFQTARDQTISRITRVCVEAVCVIHAA